MSLLARTLLIALLSAVLIGSSAGVAHASVDTPTSSDEETFEDYNPDVYWQLERTEGDFSYVSLGNTSYKVAVFNVYRNGSLDRTFTLQSYQTSRTVEFDEDPLTCEDVITVLDDLGNPVDEKAGTDVCDGGGEPVEPPVVEPPTPAKITVIAVSKPTRGYYGVVRVRCSVESSVQVKATAKTYGRALKKWRTQYREASAGVYRLKVRWDYKRAGRIRVEARCVPTDHAVKPATSNHRTLRFLANRRR